MLAAAASGSRLRSPGFLYQCKLLSPTAGAATLLRSYHPPILSLCNSTINKPTIGVVAASRDAPFRLDGNAKWNTGRRTHPNVFKAFLSDSPLSSSSSSPGGAARPYPQHPSSMLNGRLFFSTSTSTSKTDSTDSNKNDAATATKLEKAKALPQDQVADMKILRTLARYLWMKDNPEFRLRVVTALALLVGAKVLNVQVPFIFKLAIDWLTTATGNASALASFTTANSTALALFATPASVLIGYGIARSGASAFNGTIA